MKLKHIKNRLTILLFLSAYALVAQEEDSEFSVELDSLQVQELIEFQKYSDSIDATFDYKYDKQKLDDAAAIIEVPKGYKFLDKEQANVVLSEIWGNPEDPSSLGLLIKEDESPAYISYAIEVSYSEEGYIDDEDATDIDYDDLLEQMQEDARETNKERKKYGYPEVDLVGWASAPYYDSEAKKLHWAKELKFEEEDVNTLNYNIRVLGRRGYINLNVIGDMDVLEDVQTNLDPILGSVEFMPGNAYSDFNPDLDQVAAYGIGGLIAGKVLAKAGFFALIAKFWKFIAIGAVALFSAFRKRIFGSKETPSTEA